MCIGPCGRAADVGAWTQCNFGAETVCGDKFIKCSMFDRISWPPSIAPVVTMVVTLGDHGESVTGGRRGEDGLAASHFPLSLGIALCSASHAP